MALTLKQKFFVKHYLLERDATKAARAAGYAEKSADVEGARLLGNARIRAEIAKTLGPLFDKYDASIERIVKELCLIGFARMGDYVEVRGPNAYLNLATMDSERSAAISELTSDTIDQGDELPSILRTKIKLGGKMDALKTLAQYRHMLTEKVVHVGSDDPEDAPVRLMIIGNQSEIDKARKANEKVN